MTRLQIRVINGKEQTGDITAHSATMALLGKVYHQGNENVEESLKAYQPMLRRQSYYQI